MWCPCVQISGGARAPLAPPFPTPMIIVLMMRTHCVLSTCYIVYALEYIKQHCPEDSKVYLLYDVACTLQRHLKVHSQMYILYSI